MEAGPPRYDLFISYATADHAWVHEDLLPALALAPERVLIHEDFVPGLPLVKEFERAVVSSRYTLLVLSPAYLADRWAALVDLLTSHLSVTQKRAHLIPLMLARCELPLHIDALVQLDYTTLAGRTSAVARLRALLGHARPTSRAPAPLSSDRDLPDEQETISERLPSDKTPRPEAPSPASISIGGPTDQAQQHIAVNTYHTPVPAGPTLPLRLWLLLAVVGSLIVLSLALGRWIFG